MQKIFFLIFNRFSGNLCLDVLYFLFDNFDIKIDFWKYKKEHCSYSVLINITPLDIFLTMLSPAIFHQNILTDIGSCKH